MQSKRLKALKRRQASGADPDASGDDEDLLDAAALRVAKALNSRLEEELDLVDDQVPLASGGATAPSNIENDEELDTGGVSLFKGGAKLRAVSTVQVEAQPKQQRPKKRRKKRDIHDTTTANTTRESGLSSSDEEERARECAAMAVNADDLLFAAEKYAAQVKSKIAKVDATIDDDQGGKGKQRRLKREREERERRNAFLSASAD